MNTDEIIVYECDYFSVIMDEIPKRKTPIYTIITRDHYMLGEVRWYGPWRRFCFYPMDGTVWDSKCLTNVVNFIDDLMNERKNNNG